MNALILTKNQTHFLQENRQDPITGDSFSLGDEIVFCAECKSAFLKESWEFMDNQHYEQSEKLSFVSTPIPKLEAKRKTPRCILNIYSTRNKNTVNIFTLVLFMLSIFAMTILAVNITLLFQLSAIIGAFIFMLLLFIGMLGSAIISFYKIWDKKYFRKI